MKGWLKNDVIICFYLKIKHFLGVVLCWRKGSIKKKGKEWSKNAYIFCILIDDEVIMRLKV